MQTHPDELPLMPKWFTDIPGFYLHDAYYPTAYVAVEKPHYLKGWSLTQVAALDPNDIDAVRGWLKDRETTWEEWAPTHREGWANVPHQLTNHPDFPLSGGIAQGTSIARTSPRASSHSVLTVPQGSAGQDQSTGRVRNAARKQSIARGSTPLQKESQDTSRRHITNAGNIELSTSQLSSQPESSSLASLVEHHRSTVTPRQRTFDRENVPGSFEPTSLRKRH